MPAFKVTDDQIHAEARTLGWNAYAIAKKLNIDHSHLASRMRKLHSTAKRSNRCPKLEILPSCEIKSDTQTFVITCAVSGSPVHKPFLESLEQYCKKRKAQLLVVPVRYRNPTSKYENPEDWFDPLLLPYLHRDRTKLNKHLVLLADILIQPTAQRPLSDLKTITGTASCIVGHPRVASSSVPTTMGGWPKLAMSTGAVTRPSYSESKAGAKGEFHHTLAAIVVELDGKFFHLRHIHANKDGGFNDLENVEVLTLGDLHGTRHDPDALAVTIKMLHELKPAHVVLHDVLDFQSASHHADFFERFALHQAGKANVMDEIKQTCAVIAKIMAAAPKAEIHIIDSNHNSHLDRWLSDKNNAHDVENALVYHQIKTALLTAGARGERLSAFEWAAKQVNPLMGKLHWLERGESLAIGGVEHGYHGHRGANGARGSLESYLSIGAKVTIGHSHTPSREEGVVQVGTTSLKSMGYNDDAPSGWMHTHCVQYRGGKRTLVNIIGDDYRARKASKRTG